MTNVFDSEMLIDKEIQAVSAKKVARPFQNTDSLDKEIEGLLEQATEVTLA